MFEDFDREKNDGAQIPAGAIDRAVIFSIWTRLEAGDPGAAATGWALLHERYPANAQFLLLTIFDRLQGAGPEEGDAILGSCEALAKLKLQPDAVRDVLAVARSSAALLQPALAPRFRFLLGAFGAERTDSAEAGERLRRFEQVVLEELHDRTLGNRPLAPKLAAASAVHDHATLLQKNADKPVIPYSPTEHLVVGDRVQHPKFGLGVVTAKRGNKAEIKFSDARRTLICR